MLPVLSGRNITMPESDWIDREFGRMMRRFWGDGGSMPDNVSTAVYPVNIWEDNDNIHVEAEMPGFKRDEIEITLEQGVLNITAERSPRQPETQQEEANRLLNERRFVRYQRSFTLPTSVDDQNVQAHLEDGVLHLTLPKRAEVKPRKIQVT